MFTEPITEEKFFGRREVLDLLSKRVSALKDGYRQNVALTGPSLSGKSSIILHFLQLAKEEGFIPIYIEVIKESFTNFAKKFIATLLYNAFQRIGENADPDIDNLLERAQKVLPKTSHNIKQIFNSIGRQEIEEAYLGLLSVTSVLKSETGLSCVVILDEFDNLECLGIKNPFLGFGKVIMVQKDTMYIVSSSRNEAIKKIISEKLSLLFGNFEVVKIDNFDTSTSSEFISIRFAGFEINDTLKKFLISFTGGNPFYLDRLSAQMRAISENRMAGYITQEITAEAIVRLVYSSGGSINQYLFNYILSTLDTKFRDYYLSILVSISNGRNKATDISKFLRSKNADIAKALSRLLEIGLISKNGVFYQIDDTMLNFWIRAVYQRKKELLIDGIFDKTSMFEKEVKIYIDNFERSCLAMPESRIADLFNSFSNELISIESKSIRLPHFTKVDIKEFPGAGSLVVASFRGKSWIAGMYGSVVNENDVINYIKNSKSASCKASNKIIISLVGIEENARLLAKELKISIWENETLNKLLGCFNKEKLITTP